VISLQLSALLWAFYVQIGYILFKDYCHIHRLLVLLPVADLLCTYNNYKEAKTRELLIQVHSLLAVAKSVI